MKITGWIAALALLAAPAAAQSAEGTISGSILDAQRAQPIPGARIVLVPGEAGALPSADAAFIPGARVAVSGDDGGYGFTGLSAGRYRLLVTRVGYRGTTLGVELRGSADSRVSVSLSVQPIALDPVKARGEAPQPFARPARNADDDEAGAARLAAERLRLREYVPTDVHALTSADVQEAVTLGEPDVLRALQRVPGVATRDDWTAELWTRGAAWDQTRVFLDGVPLFNPLHGVGAFSGVSPNAVGAAWLHPGVLPSSLGGAAAGVLDLRTRRAMGEGRVNGLADLSVVSTGLALDQRVRDGRGGWMVAARRTYLDALAGTLRRATGDESVVIPYAFSDVAGRVDLDVGPSAALEVSGLVQRDRISGDVPDIVENVAATWGNTAGRVTLSAPLGGWRARHTVSISRYGARVRPLANDEGETPLYRASHNRVLHLALVGEVEPRGGWSGGWELSRLVVGYRGPSPIPNPREQDRPLFSPSRGLAMGAAWAERRWEAGRTTVLAGVRAEGGEAVRGGGPVRLAPRLTGRVEIGGGVSLSAGVGRSWQYTQSLLPGGLAIGSFEASYLWLLADGGRVPAIRSDVATAGVEAWFGDGWIADLDLYLRRSAGVAVPRPEPGLTAGEPLFAVATNDARGMELSIRRLVGRWTVSAGYTLARSELRADGYRWPAPEDRRHTLDATTLVRALPSLRVGAAFTASTGAAFTRRFSSEAVYDEYGDYVENVRTGPAGAQRAPDYLGLDLLVDWTRRFRGWDLNAYVQLRNVLGRDNRARYSGSVECLNENNCAGPVLDQFEPGLPRLPLIGFRVRF